MKKLFAAALISSVLFCACTQEEPAPLPPLKPVAAPVGVVGFYSGRLPCDDCNAQIVKVSLKEDSSLFMVRNTMKETMVVDSLQGVFSVNEDLVTLTFGEGKKKLSFKRDKMGNIGLLNGAGEIYRDADDRRYDLIRVIAMPKKAGDAAKPATDSAAPATDATAPAAETAAPAAKPVEEK